MHIESAAPKHIPAFVAAMAPFDRAQSDDPAVLLAHIMAESVHTFAGMVDGQPVFIGGVRPDQDRSAGMVWMLGNPGIDRAKKFYVKATREQVASMLTMFPRLYTFVDVRYPKSLRWLRAMGFQISAPFEWQGREVVQVERFA